VCPILVRVLGDRPHEELTRTRTIGLGGCMFVSNDPPTYLQLLELLIALDGRGVVRVDGRVAYTRRGGRLYEVGVEFLRVSANDRQRLSAVVGAAPPATN
jgi:hypothetical protein